MVCGHAAFQGAGYFPGCVVFSTPDADVFRLCMRLDRFPVSVRGTGLGARGYGGWKGEARAALFVFVCFMVQCSCARMRIPRVGLRINDIHE